MYAYTQFRKGFFFTLGYFSLQLCWNCSQPEQAGSQVWAATGLKHFSLQLKVRALPARTSSQRPVLLLCDAQTYSWVRAQKWDLWVWALSPAQPRQSCECLSHFGTSPNCALSNPNSAILTGEQENPQAVTMFGSCPVILGSPLGGYHTESII